MCHDHYFGILQGAQAQVVTTNAKLLISACVGLLLLLLDTWVAMQTLRGIPEPFGISKPSQLLLSIGAVPPLIMANYYLKVLKQRKAAGVEMGKTEEVSPFEVRKKARNRLLFVMVISSISALAAPAWLPILGSRLGWNGDFVAGVITTAVICTIVGLRLRKI
jgi:hypothetical protein